MSNNIRIITAGILSVTIIILWQNFFQSTEDITNHREQLEGNVVRDREVLVPYQSNTKNIKFKNYLINGSINLIGAKVDNLSLLDYKQTTQDNSKDVVLLSPVHTRDVYYVEFGWISNDKSIDLPTNESIWSSNKMYIGPYENAVLSWKNNQGSEFFIVFTLDENYMFTIDQKTLGLDNLKVKPYAAISRSLHSDVHSQMLVHEGIIGIINNKLQELKFKDLDDKRLDFSSSSNGWFGFVDKYWLTAIIPDTSSIYTTKFSGYNINNKRRYQADIVMNNNLNSNYNRIHLFLGAKRLNLIDYYQNKYK